MTDKEKIKVTLGAIPDSYSFEDFVVHYIGSRWNDFSASRMSELIDRIKYEMDHKIKNLERAQSIAYERSMYLEMYLSGQMWPNEEEAKRNLEPQIKNARAIREACKEV